MADLDGDGDLDIAVTREISVSQYQATAHLYRNDGNAVFTMEWLDATGWIHTADYARRIALAADVSGDGLQDLLLYPTYRNGPAMAILVQDGSGGFLPPVYLQGMTDYNDPWFRRLPFALGGTAGEVGAGSFTLHYTVDPALAGLTLYRQLYILDLGAQSGWSSSGGL